MLVNDRPKKVLRLKDMNSLISFEDWLKRNLSIYPSKPKVPKSHIISLLEYLREQVYSQKLAGKKEWLDTVDGLIERAKGSK
tara:strand:- start:36 stop:281 length:246 start_codon:yes stop_codon:yes gene_type:complete